MDTVYAGVAAVPLIAGLVEGAKRFGMDARFAFLLSLVLGVALSCGYAWASGGGAPRAWLDAVVVGLGLGLSASGLYSGVKKAKE